MSMHQVCLNLQVMSYMDLSKSRAGKVYEWLKQKGMDAQRILPAGYGHLKMLYPNAKEEQLQEKKNRRVKYTSSSIVMSL